MILGGRQSGLGRGLGAIIPPKPVSESQVESQKSQVQHADNAADGDRILQIPVERIDPNPHQPREHFDHTALEDLVTSIREHGVMQPIVVTPSANGRYELIAGERRLRASKVAGLATIPSIVRNATEQQKLELAIIENIQRQELNALEEAKAYLRLQNEFNLTQDQIGMRVGKSRPQVANIIRLLQLPKEIQDALAQGRISSSNARTLLSLPSEAERLELFRNMLAGNFTVRQTEARVSHPRGRRATVINPNTLTLERELRDTLGTKVVIKRDVHGEGEIKITFLNDEDLQEIKKKILGEQL